MNTYKYSLEPYKGMKTRHTCPECGHKKVFTRYIDNDSGEYVDDHVGRCSREVKCGYHYFPKQYLQDSPESRKARDWFRRPLPPPPVSYIAPDIFQASLSHYGQNHFITFLRNHFGLAITIDLMIKYFIGTSKHWPGATVFWQLDYHCKIRTGKIMLYNPDTGKRVKEPYKHINWVHSVMQIKDFNMKQCLFGEHLLTKTKSPVAIVESEKTAIIASVYLPEYTWLATGSLSNLTIDKCKALSGREVVLFPDLNAYDKWKAKAAECQRWMKIKVSDFLEKHATDEDRVKGLDLADYLLRCGKRLKNRLWGRDDLQR